MRADMRGHDITEQPSRVRRAGLGGRRPATGPRPARPGVVPVGVRPVQPARPAPPSGPGQPARPVPLAGLASSLGSGLLGSGLLRPVRRAEQRVLARRRPAAAPVRIGSRSRSALVVAALVATTATCVILLGLLADAVSAERSGAAVTSAAPAAPAQIAAIETGTALATDASTATVTVGSEETVWEVAQEIAPAASGPDVAALAERLVTGNGLSSVRVHPGQVLRVTTR